jgi:hypothetical protein
MITCIHYAYYYSLSHGLPFIDIFAEDDIREALGPFGGSAQDNFSRV